MAYYLNMNGTNAYLQIPSVTFTKIEMDLSVEHKTGVYQVYVDGRIGSQYGNFQRRDNNVDEWADSIASVLVDGVAKINNTAFVPSNQRFNLIVNYKQAFTDDVTFFKYHSANIYYTKGKIYSIKIWNGSNLEAHYDMTTGTLVDQTGKYSNATLVGGIWVEDTPPDTIPPDEITNLIETIATDSVTFNWVNPTNIDFSKVEILRDNVKVAETTTTSYQDSGLTKGIEYNYKFVTVDTTGNKSVGVVKTITLNAATPSFDFSAIRDRSTLIKIMLLQGGKGMYMVGSGYLGSDSLSTSTENQEIIPLKLTNPAKTYSLYKLSFYNDQSCHVVINNETTLYLRAGQGFNSDVGDKNITSFKIVEAGVTYNWAGAF